MHNHNSLGPRVKLDKTTKKASLRRLLGTFKPYVLLIVLITILAVLGTMFSVFSPKVLGDIISQIKEDIDNAVSISLDAINKLGLILLALYLCSFVFKFFQKYILSGITMKITEKFRSDISRKINSLPFSYFDSKNYGDTLSRITNDVDTITTAFNNAFTEVISTIVTLIGTLIMMFIVSPVLSLIILAFLPITIGISAVVMKKTQPMYHKQQDLLGKINGHIEEVYTGHLIIKSYNAEEEVEEKFNEINDSLYNAAWKAQFLSKILEPLMTLIGNIAIVTIIVVGAVLTLNGQIEIGDIVSMAMYMMMFSGPITSIVQQFTQFQSAIAAASRVFEFLDESEVPRNDSVNRLIPSDVHGDVTFDHVRFSYEPNKPIIKDFSAHIKSGEKVAIVGPTGAGKTTLVNLIMRFYDLDSGRILIDGIDISTLPRENIHDLFGMVLQDTWIFEGSVKENIVYSKTDVSEEALRNACHLANLDHFVSTLPNGYDTILSDKVSISEGQKQLITIARAMVENAPMLILDEATSSVDTRTEILIQRAMDELTRGRTSFIIAHRLSTIKNADLILVLSDGDIIEQGTHEELLERGGFYKNLYMSQFENSED